MASIVHEGTIHDRRTFARRSGDATLAGSASALTYTEGMRVSWGGVWGGVLVGMGVLLLLTALGLAVGATAVDPSQPDAQTLGIGAAIWAAVSLLIALYVGGLVSTRIGMVHDRTTGMFEGMLVWVLSVLFIAYLAGSGIGMVAGGAFKLVGGATQAIGSIVTGSSGSDLSQGSVDQIVQRLKDPQTAQTLSAATGIPEQEVQRNLSQIADKTQAARDNPALAASEVRQGVRNMIQEARSSGSLTQAAERAREGASKTAWITLLALLLSLIAAVFGAMSGRRGAAVRVGRE